MIRLIELILYGIRPFQAMTRVAFDPGLNVLTGPIGTGKSTIIDTMLALLFPSTTGQFRPFPHPHHPERAQAALTFQDEQGTRYRIIRDFIKERITLAKVDPAGTPPIAADGPGVEAAVGNLLQGLTAEQCRLRWLLTQAQLPSAMGERTNGTTVAAPAAAGPSAKPAPAAAATRARLEELKRALAKADEIGSLDEKLMAAQDRVQTLKHKLTGLSRLAEERAHLHGQLGEFAGFDQLPAGYESMVDALTERERALRTQLDGLQEQLTALEEERSMLPTEPVFRQQWFLAGAGLAGLALLMLLAAPFLNLAPLKLVSLVLLLAGFGLLVWSFLSDMKTQSRRKDLDQKTKALKKDWEGTEKRFTREQRPSLDLLALTHSKDAAVFQERARSYRRLKADIEQLDQEQEQLLGNQTTEELEQQLRQAADESKAIEEKMRETALSAGGTSTDIPSLQAEIARLEGVGGAEMPGELESALLAAPAGGPARASWTDAIRPRWPHDDPSLQSMISTLYAKLSGGRYAKIDWPNGHLQLATAEQQPVDPDLLSSGQRDLLVLLCFLAPWLQARAEHGRAPIGQFPLLLDEPFLSLDGAGQAACLQLLRSLAPAQQIILAARSPIAEQPTDHRITLPLAPQAAEATNR